MGLPENIDALLVKFDITQAQLARVADVDRSTVSRWRSGQQKMRQSQIDKICGFFELTEDDLVSTDVGLAAQEHGSIPVDSLSADEREMLGAYRALDDAQRSALLALAKAM